MSDKNPWTTSALPAETWASDEDYRRFMEDLFMFGSATSLLKEDGKQYHVPIAALTHQQGEERDG